MALSTPDLHVVCLDPPWPPNYGGAIDQFYSLQALGEAGLQVAAHVFYRTDRQPEPAPESLQLQALEFYPRVMKPTRALQLEPFVVACRRNEKLFADLQCSKRPILFQGIHTTAFAAKLRKLQPERHIALRVHNIEWKYYRALAQTEPVIWKRCWFHLESLRLKHYEQHTWPTFDRLFCISKSEADNLKAKYLPSEWLPAFIGAIPEPPKLVLPQLVLKEKTLALLYHADLSVSVNREAADFLLAALPHLPAGVRLTLAGRGLAHWRDRYRHDRCKLVPDPEDMSLLLAEHPVVVLPIWSGAGVKIKLLDSIRAGRIVLATPKAVEGSGFGPTTQLFTNTDQLVSAINNLLTEPQTEILRAQTRFQLLQKQHAPSRLVQQLGAALGL